MFKPGSSLIGIQTVKRFDFFWNILNYIFHVILSFHTT